MPNYISYEKIYLFCISAILFGCPSDDDLTDSSFTAKIDGVNFEARNDLIFAEGLEDFFIEGPILSIVGGSGDVSGVKYIDVVFQSDQLMYSGLEIIDDSTSDSQSFYVLAIYTYDENINASSDVEGGSYYAKITSIDYNTRLVSGEFSFTVVDYDTGESYVISDGVFTNIEF